MKVHGLAVPPICIFVDIAFINWNLRRLRFDKSLEEFITVRRKSILAQSIILTGLFLSLLGVRDFIT